jgi:hypothetical protein
MAWVGEYMKPTIGVYGTLSTKKTLDISVLMEKLRIFVHLMLRI